MLSTSSGSTSVAFVVGTPFCSFLSFSLVSMVTWSLLFSTVSVVTYLVDMLVNGDEVVVVDV